LKAFAYVKPFQRQAEAVQDLKLQGMRASAREID
jgi:hypothetical protein